MRITILDALPNSSGVPEPVLQTLKEAGWLHAHHRLASERFAPCVGCFECWTTHPGTCRARDAGNEVMADIMAADVVLWLVRPHFGCWSPLAKVALDRSIGLLSPFFERRNNETHHKARYERYPRWAVLALGPRDASFEDLVARNALDFLGGEPVVRWTHERVSPDGINAEVLGLLAALQQPPEQQVLPPLAFQPRERLHWTEERPADPHAVIWVGSARPTGTSTSEKLGRAFAERLEGWGWTTELLHAAKVVRLGREGAPYLVQAARRADLLVLSSPVYVDCLPSLVLAGLESLARATMQAPPALMAMVQCGFPEVSHTSHARRVAYEAAVAAGMPWAGSLALGGGVQLEGADLASARFAAHGEALDDAAVEIDAGRVLSAETRERFATPLLAPGLYRVAGQLGWLSHALRSGALGALWDRPFDTDPSVSPSKTLEV